MRDEVPIASRGLHGRVPPESVDPCMRHLDPEVQEEAPGEGRQRLPELFRRFTGQERGRHQRRVAMNVAGKLGERGMVGLLIVACGGGGDAHPADAGQAADAAPAEVTLTASDGVLGTTNLPWVAAADGAGDWTVLAGTAGTYHFPVTSGTYSLAYVCLGDLQRNVYVITATPGELATVPVLCRQERQPDAQFTVNVVGLSNGEQAWVYVAPVDSGTVTYTRPSVTFPAYTGMTDVVTLVQDANSTLRIVITRDFERRNNAVLVVDAAAGVALERHTLAVTGAMATEVVSSSTLFRTASNVVVGLRAPANQWIGVPAALLRDTDLHEVEITADEPGTSDQDVTRYVTRWVHAPQDLALAFAPPAGPFSVGKLAHVLLLLRADLPRVAGAKLYHVTCSNPSGTNLLLWHLFATPGAGSGAVVTVTMPDLTGLPGWDPAWNLEAATQKICKANTHVSASSTATVWKASTSVWPAADLADVEYATTYRSLMFVP